MVSRLVLLVSLLLATVVAPAAARTLLQGTTRYGVEQKQATNDDSNTGYAAYGR